MKKAYLRLKSEKTIRFRILNIMLTLTVLAVSMFIIGLLISNDNVIIYSVAIAIGLALLSVVHFLMSAIPRSVPYILVGAILILIFMGSATIFKSDVSRSSIVNAISAIVFCVSILLSFFDGDKHTYKAKIRRKKGDHAKIKYDDYQLLNIDNKKSPLLNNIVGLTLVIIIGVIYILSLIEAVHDYNNTDQVKLTYVINNRLWIHLHSNLSAYLNIAGLITILFAFKTSKKSIHLIEAHRIKNGNKE